MTRMKIDLGKARRWIDHGILMAENDILRGAYAIAPDPESIGRIGLVPYGDDDMMCVTYISEEQAKAWAGLAEGNT